MGKLHTLRRAIKRDPNKWKVARGAAKGNDGKWRPKNWFGFKASYLGFIKHVLFEIDPKRHLPSKKQLAEQRADVGNTDNGTPRLTKP